VSSPDDRLVSVLARRGEKARAPAGFEERLWAAIETQAAAPEGLARTSGVTSGATSARRRAVIGAAVGAVALAAAVLLWVRSSEDRTMAPAEPVLALAVRSGDGPPRRSTEAQPGDFVEVSAQLGAAVHGQLRLYRDEGLVTACWAQPPCKRDGDTLVASLPLAAVGTYHVVLIVGAAPLSEPAGDFDADVGAAFAAGADVVLRRVEVR
jgi:hypothetical protein